MHRRWSPVSRDRGSQLNKGRTRNPNHERTVLLLNIVILCLVALVAIGVAAFFYFRMQTANVALREMNDRLNGANGQDKSLYTQEELDTCVENERIIGEETGERDVKTIIQSALASGRTTLSMLRELFPEDVVVSNQGRYYFYPVADEIPENTFQEDDFAIDGRGLLAYQGDNIDVTVTQGIQVSAESGDIDWNAVAEDHVSYAMIYVGGRDSSGELTADTALRKNIKGARAAGLSVGIYYSLKARTTEEAQEDAEWLVDLLEPFADDIDSYAAIMIRTPDEGDRTQAISRTLWTDNILIVSNTLKLAGYQPMLFGNLTAMMMQTEPKAIADIARWVSNIGSDLYYPYTFNMWRYSAESTVDGIDEPVSRSVLVTIPDE